MQRCTIQKLHLQMPYGLRSWSKRSITWSASHSTSLVCLLGWSSGCLHPLAVESSRLHPAKWLLWRPRQVHKKVRRFQPLPNLKWPNPSRHRWWPQQQNDPEGNRWLFPIQIKRRNPKCFHHTWDQASLRQRQIYDWKNQEHNFHSRRYQTTVHPTGLYKIK